MSFYNFFVIYKRIVLIYFFFFTFFYKYLYCTFFVEKLFIFYHFIWIYLLIYLIHVLTDLINFNQFNFFF
jgi:hypothetical protein